MKTKETWRELVASHLLAAAEALRAQHDGECTKHFGVAVGYLQKEIRGGGGRLPALRLKQSLLDQLNEGENTARLDLALLLGKATADEE